MAISNLSTLHNILKNNQTEKWAADSEFKIQKFPQATEGVKETGKSFGDFLADSVGRINSLQEKANLAMEKLATGESKNLHETMLTVEKAEIAFKQMNQIRLKVLDAYKEVMRMQV